MNKRTKLNSERYTGASIPGKDKEESGMRRIRDLDYERAEMRILNIEQGISNIEGKCRNTKNLKGQHFSPLYIPCSIFCIKTKGPATTDYSSAAVGLNHGNPNSLSEKQKFILAFPAFPNAQSLMPLAFSMREAYSYSPLPSTHGYIHWHRVYPVCYILESRWYLPPWWVYDQAGSDR